MSYPLSRALSAATAAYAVFALVRPRHLADGIEAPSSQATAWDRTALTYGVRDLTVSALALRAGSPAVVRAAMALRVAGDLGDAAILSASAGSSGARRKVLAVTLGWAALNTAAWVLDERRG